MPRPTRVESGSVSFSAPPDSSVEISNDKTSSNPPKGPSEAVPENHLETPTHGTQSPKNASAARLRDPQSLLDTSIFPDTWRLSHSSLSTDSDTVNPHIRPSRSPPDSPNQLNVHSMRETAGSMDFELRKLVGLVVCSSANNPAFSNEFLQEMTDLAAQFMCAFSSTLRKLTDLQRHSVAGVADLELCLQMLHMSPTDLYQEYMRNKMLPDSVHQRAVPLRREVEHMLDDYYAEKYELDKDDPSLVFFTNEQYEIAALVPLQSKSRSYIPEYFPELPPDFTYRLTNSYMDTITELKKIKMKLFEESRLNEGSLYKLIDDDEKRWLEELDEQLGSLSDDDSDHKEDIMSVDGDRASDVESPVPNSADFFGEKINFDGQVSEPKASAESTASAEFSTEAAAEKLPVKPSEKLPSADTPADKPASPAIPTAEPAVEPAENPAELPVPETTEINESCADFAPDSLHSDLAVSSEAKVASTGLSEKPGGSDATPAPKSEACSEKYFDIVAYAHKKRLALERPFIELKRRQQLRKKNYYVHLEQKFSCYATQTPAKFDIAQVNSILSDSFRHVIRATRRAECAKQKRLAAEEERQSREQNEKAHGTLEFAFHEGAHSLDESDDNMEGVAALDFGDGAEGAALREPAF